MSEQARQHRHDDDGMTLVEVIIAGMVMALLTTVISAAIIVTLRQQDNIEGRLNVARAEQNVNAWIPADLSSASTVDTSPDATPCGAPVCGGIDLTGGSNVLLLSWTTVADDGSTLNTKVSYHFAPASDGLLYQLTRVKCTSSGAAWSCSSFIVLRDLPGPPAGETFVPGVLHGAACRATTNPVPCTRPDWVIIVSEALPADATSATPATPVALTGADRKDANRVIVSINGGGDAAGSGGGVNQISITAGGTVRTTIDANSVQGAPTFVEARSRCGGPITLVIDESNSIGTSITDVKAGVKRFVEALAGTPVQLQVVRFHTTSSILGSTEWNKYFDMTNQADVNTLLASINDLRGSWTTNPNGGTNWEEALFRTFNKADGTTAATIPDTVVFFTDGVPTFDRLVQRTAPGVIPAEPAAPGLPWAVSNGSVYSQIAFRRADFIANKYRRSVRFVGVGVGNGITQSSNWVVDPGAGYRTQWERGSYSHVRDTFTYEARYQKQDSKNGPFYWVNLVTYNAAANNRRQDLGWTQVTESVYRTVENPPNTNSNDGMRVTTVSTPVSAAEFAANSANAAYRTVTQTVNAGPDWEIWTGTRSGDATHYRSTELFNSPPYEAYKSAITASTRNDVVLARLIAGNDNGTPANWDGTKYTNTEIADMYVLPQWSQFGTAMEAVALGNCGGTLTLQTKLNGATPAQDPFVYQNSKVTDSAGNPVTFTPTVVTTNQQFRTGTFDLAVPNGQFVTVDIVPQNLAQLNAYTPGAWTCRAGNLNRPVVPVDIVDGGLWKGVRVKVSANEAVSCILSVTR